MSTRKFFDKTLYAQNDSMAKRAGYALLMAWDQCVEIKPSRLKTEVDITYRLRGETTWRTLEVEVKRRWAGGPFPYQDVQILHRKRKYFEAGADLLMIAADGVSGLVIAPGAILASDVVVVKNKYVYDGEEFFRVPVAHTTFVDLKPLMDLAPDTGHFVRVPIEDTNGPGFWFRGRPAL